MKLTNQIYSLLSNTIKIEYIPMSDAALNFTGCAWLDSKYQIVRNSLLKTYDIVVTDTDIIAHDDYIEKLTPSHQILFVYTGIVKDTIGHIGASKKRIRRAIEKLKASGIKCRYFASKESLEKYMAKK